MKLTPETEAAINKLTDTLANAIGDALAAEIPPGIIVGQLEGMKFGLLYRAQQNVDQLHD